MLNYDLKLFCLNNRKFRKHQLTFGCARAVLSVELLSFVSRLSYRLQIVDSHEAVVVLDILWRKQLFNRMPVFGDKHVILRNLYSSSCDQHRLCGRTCRTTIHKETTTCNNTFRYFSVDFLSRLFRVWCCFDSRLINLKQLSCEKARCCTEISQRPNHIVVSDLSSFCQEWIYLRKEGNFVSPWHLPFSNVFLQVHCKSALPQQPF